jgi:hypothetical protein
VAGIAAGQATEPRVGDGMRRIMQGAQRLIAAVLDCPKPVWRSCRAPPRLGRTSPTRHGDPADTAYFLEPFLLRGSW